MNYPNSLLLEPTTANANIHSVRQDGMDDVHTAFELLMDDAHCVMEGGGASDVQQSLSRANRSRDI